MKPLEKEAFRLVSGGKYLNSYKWNKRIAEHFFCKICGIYTHHSRRSEPDTVSINFACLDDVTFPSESEIGLSDGAIYN